jgi:hypothetical protein
LLQINPSKSNEIQTKKLGFPWIPLADSGLFNGLQRIQIKNFPALAQVAPSCLKRIPSPFTASALIESCQRENITQTSVFCKTIRENRWR